MMIGRARTCWNARERTRACRNDLKCASVRRSKPTRLVSPSPPRGATKLSRWKLENIRLTAFPAEPVLDKNRHWKAVMGTEPEAHLDQSVRGDLYSIAETPREDGGYISLRIGPNGKRIDWLAGRVQGLEPAGESLIAGEVGAWVEVMQEIADAFAAKAEVEAERLAIGMVLLEPVDSRQEGYRRLGELLEGYVKVDPESSEFRYQINRPRQSKVREGIVNRVSDWSVARKTSLQEGTQSVRAVYNFMTRLALDMSTPADSEVNITPVDQASIIQEMIELALELSDRGDIP